MIRIGTRGSDLALYQTRKVQSFLQSESEYEVVETSGDRSQDRFDSKVAEIGGQGVFVREIDARVSDGDFDAAVHSMKDMPVERPEGVEVAAVLKRDTPNDVLVSTDGKEIDDLGHGAVIGTSSQRRRAQIKRYRDDLNVQGLRGNVDTRIDKLRRGDYDAVVLSGAGLERMDIDIPSVKLSLSEFVPSANQGVIAVTARDETDEFEEIREIDHPKTRVETTAERVVLAEIGAGCVAPMGVYARIKGEHIEITAEVLSLDGEEQIRVEDKIPVESYYEGAQEVADEMVDRGAVELVEEATRDENK